MTTTMTTTLEQNVKISDIILDNHDDMVESVAEFFDGFWEVGSSDITACKQSIASEYGIDYDHMDADHHQMMRLVITRGMHLKSDREEAA